jgi:hypothetical protein
METIERTFFQAKIDVPARKHIHPIVVKTGSGMSNTAAGSNPHHQKDFAVKE